MIRILCFRCGEKRSWREILGQFLFFGVLVFSLMFGSTVLVEAEENVSISAGPLSPGQTSIDPTQQLDQQLAAVESRIQMLKDQQRLTVLESDSQDIQRDSQQVATQMESADPANFETKEMDQPEVQRLEETLVEGTYLDPFSDDANTEVIKDPWESVNAHVFSFNLNVDRYVLKPVAIGYAWVVPDPVEQAIGRAIYNIRFVPRTVNDLLQWKWENAGIEVGRFLVNSTVGVAGFFDVAGDYLDLAPVPAEDLGQTLARHGVQAGPYLVLPFLPPTTVRDGIGTVGDVFLDPLSYILPFVPQASVRATEIVNERSQNLDLYEGVEVATLDMYGAVREAYTQKRSQAIRE
ncbi:VacJ family lipoprotein [Candidatus Nitronereus thalassa]|uniref:VacJ family lipoprotein n=1 Tax=Candidatus Nitronereus thalassa TaxID=3020898 RepID=A0ABU3K8G8_9BACT|nr:VacJ family lipoprotein [Candidatus Nitronereus thalassa]MDT7042654.1 VacJ family lipoprotein [Candidatus Nitronereus thalassa]